MSDLGRVTSMYFRNYFVHQLIYYLDIAAHFMAHHQYMDLGTKRWYSNACAELGEVDITFLQSRNGR